MTQLDDELTLGQHKAWILSWLWGYRMGRTKLNPLSPGWPKGDGWAIVAAYCQRYMLDCHKVICTQREILEVFDEDAKNQKQDRIPKHLFTLEEPKLILPQ